MLIVSNFHNIKSYRWTIIYGWVIRTDSIYVLFFLLVCYFQVTSGRFVENNEQPQGKS